MLSLFSAYRGQNQPAIVLATAPLLPSFGLARSSMLSEIGSWLHRFLRLLLSGSKPAYGALAVAALVAFLYFRVFFGDRSGFRGDADKASKMPLFDRDWDPVEEQWSTMKILLWVSVSLGSGVLAYYQLPSWFPKWFR